MEKIIAQGAEAKIILSKNQIIKLRTKKSYRIKIIDEKIRKLRTRSETKILEKASKIIPVPKIIKSDEKDKKICMEFIQGKKLSQHLDSFSIKKQIEIIKQIAKNIAKLHDQNIIHGDLTTSNMILSENNLLKKSSSGAGGRGAGGGKKKNIQVYFIDFGLGFHSTKIEDKAVDLHLLKQALEAKHFQNHEKLFKEFEKTYKEILGKEATKVLEKLTSVEKRGRYKH